MREGEIQPVLGAKFFLTIKVLSKRMSFSGEVVWEKGNAVRFWGWFFFGEWEEMLTPFGVVLLSSQEYQDTQPFFLLSLFSKRSSRSGISCEIVRKCCPLLERFFMHGKTCPLFGLNFLRAEGNDVHRLSYQKEETLSIFRSFLLSKRRSGCRFCSWASSQEQEDIPSILWPRLFLLIWWRRDSCPFFWPSIFVWTRFMPLPKNRRKPFPYFSQCFGPFDGETNRTISTTAWEYDVFLLL